MREVGVVDLLVAICGDGVGPAGPAVKVIVVDGHAVLLVGADRFTLTNGHVEIFERAVVHEVTNFLYGKCCGDEKENSNLKYNHTEDSNIFFMKFKDLFKRPYIPPEMPESGDGNTR